MIGVAFVVGLVLAVCDYVVQFATNTNFGGLTPLISATVPPLIALVVGFVGDNDHG